MKSGLQTRDIKIAEGDILDPEGPPPTQFRRADGTFVKGERYYLLSTPEAVIQVGMTQEIHVRPYALFRPQRLMLAPDVASEVDILDIKVGHTSQLSLVGVAAGELFNTQNPHPFDLKMDVVLPSVVLGLIVRNKKPYTIAFSATFGGQLME